MNSQELFPLEWTGWFSLLSKGLWGVFSNSTVQKHQFFGAQLSLSEKAMAPHSSTLAWEIPWMEEPGRLQSMGSWRVRHNWATSLSLFTFMHWRRKWQPTLVFLPRESQGQEPGGLPSMGSHRVGRDWRDLAAVAFFIVQLSHTFMTTGNIIALTRWTFVGEVMSLLFNMLSRLLITFLPRSRHLLISMLQSPSAVIWHPKT